MKSKSIKLIYILLIIVFFATGCAGTANEIGLQIVAPKNTDIAIQGTWQITDVLRQSSTEEKQHWVGETIIFTNELAMVGNYSIMNVDYQVKRVVAEEYLLYNYKAFPEDFNFSQEEIEIITVIDQEVFFCEVLKEKEGELILKIYNDSFILEKISDEVDEEFLKQLKKESDLEENLESLPQDSLLRTGVLVGLRQNQSYRTLWIASKNKKLHPFLETEDIFFPRRDGFWKMEIDRIREGSRLEDTLVAYNVFSKEEMPLEKLQKQAIGLQEKEEVIYRTINYISNDYVSIEERILERQQGEKILKKYGLHILTIDSLPNIRRVNILDLLGNAGIEAAENGRNRVLGTNIDNNILLIEDGKENYGLERRLGYWLLKGRVSYLEEGELNTIDYNINLIPPSKLVFYDELSITWTTVKDKIPTAVDLYTSPNRDIALVVTKEEIMVFAIEGQNLQEDPLERIALKEGETVIMAEWATGPYVEYWEKTLVHYIEEGQ